MDCSLHASDVVYLQTKHFVRCCNPGNVQAKPLSLKCCVESRNGQSKALNGKDTFLCELAEISMVAEAA